MWSNVVINRNRIACTQFRHTTTKMELSHVYSEVVILDILSSLCEKGLGFDRWFLSKEVFWDTLGVRRYSFRSV